MFGLLPKYTMVDITEIRQEFTHLHYLQVQELFSVVVFYN